MKHLIYAAFADGALAAPLPPGPEGVPVVIVAHNGLAAACSAVPDTVAAPTVPQLLAYADVVEALHAQRTTLPLRFGCLLRDEAAVRGLLAERGAEFRSTLARLDGCEEAGIRLLPAAETPPALPVAAAGGAAYLAARRARLAALDARQRLAEDAAQHLTAALGPSALAVRAAPVPGEPTAPLSFHVLTRRADRTPFREAFRRLQADSRDRLLLTGPWPPYHFADPAPPGVC